MIICFMIVTTKKTKTTDNDGDDTKMRIIHLVSQI